MEKIGIGEGATDSEGRCSRLGHIFFVGHSPVSRNGMTTQPKTLVELTDAELEAELRAVGDRMKALWSERRSRQRKLDVASIIGGLITERTKQPTTEAPTPLRRRI
jgi:hypothetical protein